MYFEISLIISSLAKAETKWPCVPWPSKIPNKLKPFIPLTFIFTKKLSWFVFIFPSWFLPACDPSQWALKKWSWILFVFSAINVLFSEDSTEAKLFDIFAFLFASSSSKINWLLLLSTNWPVDRTFEEIYYVILFKYFFFVNYFPDRVRSTRIVYIIGYGTLR